MVTSQTITRVFQLKLRNGTGTCFAIDVDNRQYLCTAKHCLPSFTDSSVEIRHDKRWKRLGVSLVGYGSQGSDICVLAPNVPIVGHDQALRATSEDLRYGQDVFFFGFPYGMQMDSVNLNRDFPFPFVKRATLSAWGGGNNALNTAFLDGHNNPGFSGGPVVFTPVGRPKGEWRVAAIVSGYESEKIPLRMPDGKQTGLWVASNTGIVRAHGIMHALDAIDANPIGSSLRHRYNKTVTT